MKKILYLAFALVATAFVGCSEADNGASSADTKPIVTAYEIATSADVDPDTSIALRLAPNALTSEYYVCAVKETEKEAIVAEGGEQALMEYVIENGTCYTEVRQDVVLTGLAGKYVVAIVAVAADGAMQLVEKPYEGILWMDYAEGQYQSSIIRTMFSGGLPYVKSVVMQKMDGADIYRLVNPYLSILGPYQSMLASQGFHSFASRAHFVFKWDGGAAIKPQVTPNGDGYYPMPVGVSYGNYGAMSFTVDANPAYSYFVADLTGEGNPGFVLNGKLTVSAGALVSWSNDYYIITKLY